MIGAKEAVGRAMASFKELVGVERAREALLEEVEAEQSGENGHWRWRVTISVPLDTSALAALAGGKGRDYKVLTIDGDSGEFISMKIRQD